MRAHVSRPDADRSGRSRSRSSLAGSSRTGSSLAGSSLAGSSLAGSSQSGSSRSGWSRFRSWARERPFVGGLLVVLGGIELFCSGQLDLGNIRIQFGVEGLQATVIPVALVVLGVLAVCSPAQRLFYGIVALALAVYSLIGVNLGGFVLGMLLATVGGVLVVAWMPRVRRGSADAADASAGPS